MQRPSWIRLSTIFGFCTVLVFFFASQLYFFFENQGSPIPLWEAFLWAAADWYTWALLAPVVLEITRRFPIDLKAKGRHIFVHLAAAPIVSFTFLLGSLVLEIFVHQCVGRDATALAIFQSLFVQKFLLNILIYGGLVSVGHAVDFYHRYRERALRASQLETRLAQAQLSVLRAQMQPHFLFNTLNTISALMHSDVDAADRMIARLSDLLRYSLRSVDQQEVTFRQEMDFLKGYLEIEETRFRDRLSVDIDIEEAAYGISVPCFILQPLVENAIRHGIAPRPAPGRIEIKARCEIDALVIDILDDGLGLPMDFNMRKTTGVGVKNTRERLEQRHQGQDCFSIRPREGGGVHVRVKIPHEQSVPVPQRHLESRPDGELATGRVRTQRLGGNSPLPEPI